MSKTRPQGADGLYQARYVEFLADLIGACLISLAVGAWFASSLSSWAPLLLVLGVPLHSWGMFRIHRRNR
jgi:hypothetical protein